MMLDIGLNDQFNELPQCNTIGCGELEIKYRVSHSKLGKVN